MRLWRISDFDDLKGIGGTLAPGRWHSKGSPVVYLAENPALALLEILVHADTGHFPETVQLLEVDVPRVRPFVPQLKDFWKEDLYYSRDIGDSWLATSKSWLLKVPSALVPRSINYLMNPSHPSAGVARIVSKETFSLDQRLK